MPFWHGLVAGSGALRDCPCVSPPEGALGGSHPSDPPARSRRGGSARAVLILLANNSASLCEALCRERLLRLGSQRGPGPGAASPAGRGVRGPGAMHLAGGSARSPWGPIGAWRELRAAGLAAPRGFWTLLTFSSPSCRRAGTGLQGAQPGEGCGGAPGSAPAPGCRGERECDCGGGFPVNVQKGDGAALGFLLVPLAPPSECEMVSPLTRDGGQQPR